MRSFDESIVIDRPMDEVVAFATDWFNGPRDGSVLAFRQTSPGTPGVGTTLEGRMVILGFETRFKTRITEWDLTRAVAFVSVGGPFRSLVLRVTLEAIADGTRMVESRNIELRPALKLLGPLVVPFWRRRTKAAQKNFKRLVEAQPRQTSRPREADHVGARQGRSSRLPMADPPVHRPPRLSSCSFPLRRLRRSLSARVRAAGL